MLRASKRRFKARLVLKAKRREMGAVKEAIPMEKEAFIGTLILRAINDTIKDQTTVQYRRSNSWQNCWRCWRFGPGYEMSSISPKGTDLVVVPVYIGPCPGVGRVTLGVRWSQQQSFSTKWVKIGQIKYTLLYRILFYFWNSNIMYCTAPVSGSTLWLAIAVRLLARNNNNPSTIIIFIFKKKDVILKQ